MIAMAAKADHGRLRHPGLCAGDRGDGADDQVQALSVGARSTTMAKQKPAQKPEIDRELIHELAKLLDETGLTEIEIERDGAAGARRRAAAEVSHVVGAPAPHARHRRRAVAGCGAAGRSRQAPGRRRLADGRHRLSRAGARRDAVRRRRQQGRRGRYAADHRGDEDHEPDTGAALGHGDANPDRATRQPVEFGEPLMIIE